MAEKGIRNIGLAAGSVLALTTLPDCQERQDIQVQIDESKVAIDRAANTSPPLPENLQQHHFYLDAEGDLRRVGHTGIYEIKDDGDIIYVDPTGNILTWKKGTDLDGDWYHKATPIRKCFPGTQGCDEELYLTKNSQKKIPPHLQSFGFYYDTNGILRRERYPGSYTVQDDGSTIYSEGESKRKHLLPKGGKVWGEWEKMD